MAEENAEILVGLFDQDKIKGVSGPVDLDELEVEEENQDDDVISVMTRVPKEEQRKNLGNLLRMTSKRKRKKHTFIPNLSDNSDDSDDSDMDYDSSGLLFLEDNDRIKYEYRKTIDAYGKRGFDISQFDPSGDLSHHRIVHDSIIYEAKRRSKYSFFKNLIWLISFIVEKAVVNIRSDLKLKGWSKQVWSEIENYRPYFDDMTKPIIFYDSETGRTVQKENPSIINKINLSPEIMVFIALLRSAITYAFIRNISKFTESLSIDDDFDDDSDSDSDVDDLLSSKKDT